MGSLFDSMLIGSAMQFSDGREGFVIAAGPSWVVYTDGEHIWRMPRVEYNHIVLPAQEVTRSSKREDDTPTWQAR